MDSKKGEFIYSTHLWGSNINMASKTSGKTSSAPKQAPKTKVIENQRKESGHEWDHE